MLLEFSLENYRSFGPEQTLSMSAGRFHSERIGAVMDSGSKSAPHVLRAAAILGANGAGKSSLIGGLGFFQNFIMTSAQGMQKGERIGVQPHLLDAEYRDKPSRFEIRFFYKEVEYTYSICVTQKHVVDECLIERASGSSMRQVFSRQRKGDGEYEWNLGSLPKSNARLWRQSTRDNALFLSTAIQLNSKELDAPFEWLSKKLRVQESNEPFFPAHTAHLIKDHVEDGCSKEVLNLIREADLGIRNILIQESGVEEQRFPAGMPEELRKKILEDLKDEKFLKPTFEHRALDNKTVDFELEDESDGTQRLFEMAGPIVSSLRHDYTFVIDEIDTSLHTFLVRLIIQKFQNPDSPKSKAQLIFSSHNDGLLDSGLLERDQFWFVEKHRGQSSLTPLLEYKPRKGEAMRLKYLRGRYGGVPAISRVKIP